LNQAPGKFSIDKSFRIDFANGESYYFAADVEVFGLTAMLQNSPQGMLFEVDVVVIPKQRVHDMLNNYRGYPAPQHIDSVYECKFGKYHKGQLRELLGLRRHISYLEGDSIRHAINHVPNHLFYFEILNSSPPIPVKMIRPLRCSFFDLATASLYDMQEVVI
jgi:hypothetical protein